MKTPANATNKKKTELTANSKGNNGKREGTGEGTSWCGCMGFIGLVVFLYLVYWGVSYYAFFGLDNIGSSVGWDASLPKTKEKRINLRVDLENIYRGDSVDITIEKTVICSHCSGSGADTPNDISVCPACNGRGYHDVVHRMGFMQFQAQERCPSCGGKGKTISHKCPICQAAGIVQKKEKMSLAIPKGIPEHYVMTIPHGSDQYPGYAPGDLIFDITSVSSTIPFRRESSDLHYEFSITLLEALVGFNKQIPHFDGPVTVESKQITIPNQLITIQKKGLPILDKPGSYGNLHVHVTVVFPAKVKESDKEAYKKLLGQ